jgi:hypothetical protein
MIGSYYNVTPAMYRPPPPGTPGWQRAPVPGWGVNPWRAGPPRVGVGEISSMWCTTKIVLWSIPIFLVGGFSFLYARAYFEKQGYYD